MEINELTKQFRKQTVPDFNIGDTVRVHYKITEGGKTRIQVFEGICIALKHGKGLDGTIKVRTISDGIGVERTFPIHSPLITKFERTKSRQVQRAKLYFLRGLTGKKAKKIREKKDYGMWEEAISEEEINKIEEEKAKAAEEKAKVKAEKEKELEEKFEHAVEAHKEADKE